MVNCLMLDLLQGETLRLGQILVFGIYIINQKGFLSGTASPVHSLTQHARARKCLGHQRLPIA